MIYQHAADDRDRRIAEDLDAMAGEAGSSPPEAASVETPSVSRTGAAHGRGFRGAGDRRRYKANVGRAL